MSEEKVRENKIRRKLKRMGLILKKSRARDPQARGYGGYAIIDEDLGIIVAGATRCAYDLSLDNVEAHIQELDDVVKEAKEDSAIDELQQNAMDRLLVPILNDYNMLGSKATYKKWRSAWDGEHSELVRAVYPAKVFFLQMLRVFCGHS